MAFSDNAIGFYLEIDNTTFSSTLASAEKDYDRFVKALTKHNKAAFDSASKGLGSVEDLVEALAELPERAALATRRAQGRIAKEMKPLAMKVDLQLNARARGTLKKAVREAVGEALTGVKIRLGASTPQRRLGMFNTELSLRAQYEGIPQPPDMVGRLQPKKFATGGIVEGPQKGFDSVLSLLQPGEMVLPKDVSDQLQELAGAAIEGAGGQFIDPDELAKAFVEVENLARGLDKLKKIADAGFASDDDIKMLEAGMAQLKRETFALDDAFNDLSFTSKVRLSPAIEQVHNRMGDLIDQTEKAMPPAERLLTQILGPARFLAVNKALDQVSDTMGKLGNNVASTYSKLGGEEIGSAVESINRMNQFLGLSRTELRSLKADAAVAAAEIDGINVNEFAASLATAAELGIRDQKVMFDLARSASLAAQGLGVATEAATDLGFELTGSVGLSQEAFDGLLGSMGRLSDSTSGFNISSQQLFEATKNDVATLGSALRALSEEDAQTVLTSMNRLGAVMQSNFIDAGPEIRQTLAKAFEGGPQNIDAMRQAALLTGMSVDDLRDRLKSGDIEGIFDAIAESTQGMGTEQLRAFADQVGVTSADLVKMRDNVGSLNEGFERSAELIPDNAEALGLLQERATANRTLFERLSETFTDTVGKMSLFGVQGIEVLDFLKEFNASTLLSIGFLVKWGAQAVIAGVKAGGKLLPVLGKVGGMLGGKGGGVAGGVGKLTSAAGGASGGGAIAGIFTGLSTGLATLATGVATLGAVLLSPPGIAFTISFVAAVLALGGAARLAAPALEVMGKVVMHMIDGVVEIGKAFLALDPKRMLAAGPGLIALAAGFTAMGGGLTVFGAGAGAAAIGFGALTVATRLAGSLRGGGISGVLEALIADLEPLGPMAPRLRAINKSLGMVTDFLIEFAKVSGALTVLGGAALFQNLVDGFLNLIGIGSPMDHLASRSAGVATVVETMLGNFTKLSAFTPDMLSGITTTLRMMIGFMGDYARLSEAIDELPGGGVFSNIGDAIGGLFGADSPAEKLAEASGPIVDAMERLLSRFSQLQNITQPRQTNAVSPAAIQQVVEATLARDADGGLGDKLDAQTKLLEAMLMALKEQTAQGKGRPEPSTRVIRGPSSGSSFARDVAGGDY